MTWTFQQLYRIWSDSDHRRVFQQCAGLYAFLQSEMDIQHNVRGSFRYIYSRTGISPVNLPAVTKALEKYGLIRFKKGNTPKPHLFHILDTPPTGGQVYLHEKNTELGQAVI